MSGSHASTQALTNPRAAWIRTLLGAWQYGHLPLPRITASGESGVRSAVDDGHRGLTGAADVEGPQGGDAFPSCDVSVTDHTNPAVTDTVNIHRCSPVSLAVVVRLAAGADRKGPDTERHVPQQPEQPQQGRTGRNPTTARRVRDVVLAAALILLATACSNSGEDEPSAKSDPSRTAGAPAAGVVAPAKVEVIARLTGCKANIRVEADELREGLCHTKQGDYLITTFPEERYQQTWLETASMYGGKYLVGTRWVVAAKPKVLEQFRSKLGGTIQQMRGMGPTPVPSAS